MHTPRFIAIALSVGAAGCAGETGESDTGEPLADAAEVTDADVTPDTDDVVTDDSETADVGDLADSDIIFASDTVDATPDTAPDASDRVPVDGPATPDPSAETESMGAPTECGNPRIFTGRGLRRAPYVQSVFTDRARVAWTDTFGAEGFVHYSVAGSDEWFRTSAESEVFTTDRTADTEEYTAYEARLRGLPADSLICYEVYVDGALLVADGSFRTAWTTRDKPVRVLAMGDSGNLSPEQFAVRDRMMEVESDVFLHLGDMAYGDGTFPEFEERVFAVYRDLMSAIPAWPTPGNHEYKTGLADGYIGVYYLPEQAPRATDNEYYYSFDYGNVHFISLDSNEYRYVTTLGPGDDDMLGWLERDLEEAQDADWIIAFMHHPPYSSGSHGNTNWVLQVIVPMLEEAGVDLVLAGHDHHYERTHPILGEEVAPDAANAMTYVLAGAGGAGLREATGDWRTSAVDDQIHNFLYLEIDGCEARGTAIGLNGETVDEFELVGCR